MRNFAGLAIVAASACSLTSEVPTLQTALPPALPDDVFSTLNDSADAHAELCAHDPTDTTFPRERRSHHEGVLSGRAGRRGADPTRSERPAHAVRARLHRSDRRQRRRRQPGVRDPRPLIGTDRARGVVDRADRVRVHATCRGRHAAGGFHLPGVRPGRGVRRSRSVLARRQRRRLLSRALRQDVHERARRDARPTTC